MQELQLFPRWSRGAAGAEARAKEGSWGTHAAEPLSGHSRDRSDTQERGGAGRKEPEGRN